MQIILASSSPRRIEILKNNHLNPLVIPPNVEENLSDDLTMEQAVMFLALKKALWVEQEWLKLKKQKSAQMQEQDQQGNLPSKVSMILAADTVVYKDRIIGKPSGFNDAVNILKELRNTSHLVSTGVALIEPDTHHRKVFCEITEVFFENYTDDNIMEYVNSGEALDKAGAYAIQGSFGKYISHIKGDYLNVVGLPWIRVKEELTKMSLSPF